MKSESVILLICAQFTFDQWDVYRELQVKRLSFEAYEFSYAWIDFFIGLLYTYTIN